jgi:hypothetical protein
MTVGLATNLLRSHTRLDRVSRVSVSEYFWFCEARTSLEPEVYGSPIGVGDDGATWDGDGGAAWVEDGISSLLSHTRLDRVSRVSVSEYFCFCEARTSLEPEVYGSPIGVGDDGASWVGNDGGAWVEDGINSLLSHTRLDRVSRVSVSECLCFCGALRIAMLARNDRVIGPRWFYMLFNIRV